MRPTTSILIPVYNREALVAECIQSALDQTVTDLEVVVVDNASTDATWEVCQRFAEVDNRVRIFRNDSNLGPVNNWMRCIREARGTYGKILFSDDLMGPTFLERALPLIEDPQVGLVFSSVEIGTVPGTGSNAYWRYNTGAYPSRSFILESLCDNKMPVSPGAALFRLVDLRANLVTDIPSSTGIDFARNGAGPDQLLYLLTARDYPLIAYIAAPVSFFRKHDGSITVSENNDSLWLQYFQARLWYARTTVGARAPLPDNLLQCCLVSGWLQQRRWRPEVTLAEFTGQFLGESPRGMFFALLWVRWFRLWLRGGRSLTKRRSNRP